MKILVTSIKSIVISHKLIIGVFLLFFLLSLIVRRDPLSDDGFFSTVHTHYNLVDFVRFRYNTWSARVLSEGLLYYLSYLNIFIWRLINTFSWTLLAYSLAKTVNKDYRKYFLQSLTLIFCINVGIMASSGFQLTASINYILPLSLMMYAIAPIFLSINSGDKLIATKLSRPGLLLLPLTALLNEQIGFVVAIILVTFLSIKYVQSKKIDWTLVTVLGVMSVILIWVTIAKGNDMRFASSVEYWYPNFIKIGLMGRLKVYLIWLFTSLFVKLNSLMIVAALIISPFVYKRSDMSLKRMLLLAFLLVPILAPLLNNGYSDQFYPILQKMLYTFDFRGVYKSIGGGLPIYGGKLIFIVSTYVFWSAYLSILLIHLYKNLRRIILVVPVVAALASMAIFIFSPTLFGSGSRILLAPAVMILTCLIPLFIKAPKEIRVAVYIFALVNFANLLSLWAVSGYHSIY